MKWRSIPSRSAGHRLRRITHAGSQPGQAPSSRCSWSASDPDGDALTYSATGLPSGLTLNTATGLISGTLSPASAGTHQVAVTASDSSLSQHPDLHLDGHALNRGPALDSPGSQNSAENTTILLALNASDPDGTPLTFSAIGLPASLTIDAASGVISGTLSFSSAGSYLVQTAVSDGSLSSTQSFVWTIGNTNRAPVLLNPGSQTLALSSYSQTVLSDGPAAYWRLGEASGPTVADFAGTNPATLMGGVAPGQPGALDDGNLAMLFNGTNSYLGVANSAALQLAGDLTIEMWINVSLASRQTLISKGYLREFELTLEVDGRLSFYQGTAPPTTGLLSSGSVARQTRGSTWW